MSDGQPELASTEARPRTSAAPLAAEEVARGLAAHRRLFGCIAAGVLGAPGAVEDVLQEAAAIALEKRASFQLGTSFPAWMGQIVKNVARNHARRAVRGATAELPEGLAATVPGPPDGGSGAVDASELSADPGRHFDDRVVGALRTLSDTARVCLLLRTVLELDYTAIAATLGIPEGTAMSHVHRARRRLRELLSEPSGTVPTPPHHP